MRWSVVRVIWFRETRDQLRDRRTLLMIGVLPVFLYPVLGLAVLQFALGFVDRPRILGIVQDVSGSRDFPPAPADAHLSPLPPLSWLRITPSPIGTPAGQFGSAAALALVSHDALDYPQLIQDGQLSARYNRPGAGLLGGTSRKVTVTFLAPSAVQKELETNKVDVVLSAPQDFWGEVLRGRRPTLRIQTRPDDDGSRQALQRLHAALGTWKRDLTQVRLVRQGLGSDFDDPFAVLDPDSGKLTTQAAAESLYDLMLRVFPFLLVLWSLAGALYPAVDLCAGEKERGTMETLLISPARREEIVWGKFLTIWLFSTATALLNLASMAVTTWQFSGQFLQEAMAPGALLWCVFLVLPLSAFFSSISLAIGAYARSTKEGQYYLMPLFLLTMPLIFLTLAPGVQLNPFYSMVPVTGVALLLHRLLTATTLDQVPWLYFLPVLAPMALYSWLALCWAIEQFQSEEVLFREAERLDLRLWLRSLFREKSPKPTAGQALFCFAVVLALNWLGLTVVGEESAHSLTYVAVSQLALVAAPTLFMAVLLTKRPLWGLGLRLPIPVFWPIGALLGASLVPLVVVPFAENLPIFQEVRALRESGELDPGGVSYYVLVLVVLPAVCQELAFRGFILNGLRRRFSLLLACIINSILYAVYHLNVFQILPAFLLGLALALLAYRCASTLPGMMLHLIHNGLLLAVALAWSGTGDVSAVFAVPTTALLVASALGTTALLWWLRLTPKKDMLAARAD
jgi:sodium transport system permease protein